MPDKKLTDNEIIKALEICGTYKGRCTDCPAFVKVDRSNCKQVLIGALDIITRQKAEIKKNENIIRLADKTIETANAEIERLEEKLNIELENYATEYDNKIKAEAYKEFAEKLHEELRMYGVKDKFNKSVFLNVVDKAKKELVGENDA